MRNASRFERCLVHVSKTLFDAMKALEEGLARMAIVVDDDKRLVGLLTDGNVRRALLRGAPLTAPLEPHVTRRFISVGPGAGRAEVLELMQARTIEQVPIVDENQRLVGLHLLHELLGAVPRPNWAVVLAGGRGLRLGSLTETTPKPMLKVAGRPILERIVLHLVGFGIQRIFISVNYLAHVIQDHFGAGERFGCRIEYLVENQPLGTGGCLSLLPERPTAPLLVLNGDLITQFDAGNLLDAHEARRHLLTVGTREHQYTVPFGVLESEDGLVRRIQEKPVHAWQTNAGIYVVAPALLERVPHDRTYDMPSLIANCLGRGEPVGTYPVDEDWIDVGQVRELKRARGEHD